MMISIPLWASAAALLGSLPAVRAGYRATADDNLSVYWGQNSFGQLGFPAGQQRLSYYCESKLNTVLLLFMTISDDSFL